MNIDEQPTMECTRCGATLEDYDGVGVIAHLECGYCTHPALDGNVCCICGLIEGTPAYFAARKTEINNDCN